MNNDDSQQPSQKKLVELTKHADLLLRKADALGTFPTPVDELIKAANLEIARESALDRVYLGNIYRSLPNRYKLMPKVIKKAMTKVSGLLYRPARTIHIDPELHPKKEPFVKMHEVGHDVIPWQRKLYAIMEDSQSELDPLTRDMFEVEANIFAAETLFQLDTFEKEAADHHFGITTPLNLSKRYGTGFHSTARRYTVTSQRPCAILIYEKPVMVEGIGQVICLRQALHSPSFIKRFGNIPWATQAGPGHLFNLLIPNPKFTPPTPYQLTDMNGVIANCLIEGFDSSYNIFYLIYVSSEVKFRVNIQA